jgi:hypothetical protein
MKSNLGLRCAGAFGWIGVLALSIAPVIAFADETKPAGADEKDAKQKVKEAEERLRQERRQLHDALRDGGSAEHIKQLDKEVAEASGALAQAKLRARELERARLIKNGYVIPPDKLRGEWHKHALRVAKLRRIRELAVAVSDGESVARVDALAAKENRRHELWIDKRRAEEGGAPPAPIVPAAPTAVAAASPPAGPPAPVSSAMVVAVAGPASVMGQDGGAP